MDVLTVSSKPVSRFLSERYYLTIDQNLAINLSSKTKEVVTFNVEFRIIISTNESVAA